MDFRLNQDQLALRIAAQSLLRKHCTPERNLKLWSEGVNCDTSLWEMLKSLEWFSLCAPEHVGGMELGALELSLITEEIGYASAIGPISSTLSASAILAKANKNEFLDAKFQEIIAGNERIAIGGSSVKHTPTLKNREDLIARQHSRSELSISGTVFFVPFAQEVQSILVPVNLESGRLGAALIDIQHQNVLITPLSNIDGSMSCGHVTFSGKLIPVGAWFETKHSTISDIYCIAIASEILGACRRCLDLSVEYAKVRTQFGRPIGSFQSVRHLCSDMYMEIENLSSIVAYTAYAIGSPQSFTASTVSVACMTAVSVGTKVWTYALQVHGGIGFTWEYEINLCIKRIVALQAMLGSPDDHAESFLNEMLMTKI